MQPFDLPLDARAAIQILCGIFLLPHTIAKLRHIDKASVLFNKVGLRPAKPLVVLTALGELTAAVSLVFNWYPKIGALIAATILVAASYAIARANSLMWRWQHPGIEYMCFWAAVCLCVTFLPY